jgi:hypothetical protein
MHFRVKPCKNGGSMSAADGDGPGTAGIPSASSRPHHERFAVMNASPARQSEYGHCEVPHIAYDAMYRMLAAAMLAVLLRPRRPGQFCGAAAA